MTPLQERFKEAIGDYDEDSVRFGKQGIAIACEAITIEMMREFAEWMDDNGCTKFNGGWASIINTEIIFTLDELIQKFLNKG